MLDQVEEITVPDEWRNTDLVKQTKEVMVSEEGFRFTDLIFGSIRYFYYDFIYCYYYLHHYYLKTVKIVKISWFTIGNKIINLKIK